MTTSDWRDAPAHLLAPVYASERERSLRTLQWDSAPVWFEVEQARTMWGLPGLLACDDAGRVRGLLFYVEDGVRVDVGGIVSDDAAATDALLDGVMKAASRPASSIRMLVPEGPAALRDGLRRRDFAIEPHLYLARSVQPGTALPGFDTWRDDDIARMATLLRQSYEPSRGSLFAPYNSPDEWERYVRNLVTHPGCGVFNPGMTAVMRERNGLRAAGMVTDIAPGVAHLVQLAVEPATRGGGIGRRLVEEICARVGARGYRVLTLLVASGNAPARALYARTGFHQEAVFLGATLCT